MKYLMLLALTFVFSCKKDSDTPAPSTDPSVSAFQLSSDNSTGANTPKLVFTLSIPDTTKLNVLYINRMTQTGIYPNIAVAKIVNPKATEYTVLDKTTTYPFSVPMEYTFSFFKDSLVTAFKVYQVK